MCPAPQRPALPITIASNGGHHRPPTAVQERLPPQHLRRKTPSSRGLRPSTPQPTNKWNKHNIPTRPTLLETVLAQINALMEQSTALNNQIEKKQPSNGVEHAIQQSPTDWLQTQLQKFQQRIHCTLTWKDVPSWGTLSPKDKRIASTIRKRVNHIVRHRHYGDRNRLLTFLNW